MAVGAGERGLDPVGAMRGRARSRAGFTLAEVLVALVVLGVGAAGLIQLLGQAQRQNSRRRASEAALRIAENEVQRVRSAGPWSVPAAGAAARVDGSGAPDPAGAYRVQVGRSLSCDAASARLDDRSAGTSPPCPGALARVAVRVEHLRGGAWTVLAERTIATGGEGAAGGSWSLAGAP